MATIVLLLLIAAAVLVVAGVAFVGLRGRGKGVELEPPPTPRAAPQVTPPDTHEAGGDGAVIEVVEPPLVEAEPEVRVRPRFRDRLGKARGAVGATSGSILSRVRHRRRDLGRAGGGADPGRRGHRPTTELLDALRARVKAEGSPSQRQLLEALKAELKARLAGLRPLAAPAPTPPPSVWLFVGRQRRGQDHHHRQAGPSARRPTGRKVVMAAGDTFRAAAGRAARDVGRALPAPTSCGAPRAATPAR